MSGLAHTLLIHLDYLKPTMQLKLSSMEDASKFLLQQMPRDQYLEFWVIEASKVEHFFPQFYYSIVPVVNMLSFKTPSTGVVVVSILDLLISLCLLMEGPWDRKAKMLFTWHNISQNGMLEESEHYLLIKRVVGCLKKLKLIQSLTVTNDEAKYMAVSARVMVDKKTNCRSFRPGLFFEDFLDWTETNEECQTMFRFVSVLHRLVDNLCALNNRSDRLMDITNQKYNARIDPLPRPFTNSKLLDESIVHFFCTEELLHLTFPNTTRHETTWYVQIDTETPSPDIFHYEIPGKIIERNKKLHKLSLEPDVQCCHKFYTVTKMMKIDVPSKPRNASNNVQVVISKVSSRLSHSITLFNNHIKLNTIRLKSLPVPSSSIERKDQSLVNQYTKVVVLPSSFSMNQFSNLRKHQSRQSNLLSTGTIFFTGSLFSINDVALPIINLLRSCRSGDVKTNYSRHLITSLKTIVRNHFRLSFNRNLTLFSSLLFCRSASNPTIVSEQLNQVVFLHTGEAMWDLQSDSLWRECLAPAEYDLLRKELQKIYYLETLPFFPSFSQEVKLGKFLVWHVMKSGYGQTSEEGMTEFNVETLVELILDKMENLYFDAVSTNSVIVVMKDPSDLFMDIATQCDEPLVLSGQSADSAESSSFPQVTWQQNDVLYGRYELDHGEYSSQARQSMTSPMKKEQILASKLKSIEKTIADDKIDTRNPFWKKSVYVFVKVLFSYASSLFQLQQQTHCETSSVNVTLVSTSWKDGRNFQLVKVSGDSTITIKHESLLGVQDEELANDKTAKIMKSLQASLPIEVIMDSQSTPTTSQLLCCEQTQDHLDIQSTPVSTVLGDCESSENSSHIVIPIHCMAGPHCSSLSHNDAHFQVVIAGKGVVTCTLYEIPISMTSTIFQSFVSSSERRQSLIQIGEIKTYSFINNIFGLTNPITIYYENLRPYSSYGLVLSFRSKEQEHLETTIFRTLPSPQPRVDYFLFSPLTAKDYEGHTLRWEKLLQLSKLTRFSLPFLVGMYSFACYGNYEEQMRTNYVNFTRRKSIMDELSRTVPVLHQSPYLFEPDELSGNFTKNLTRSMKSDTSVFKYHLELNKYTNNVITRRRTRRFSSTVKSGYQVTTRGTFCYLTLNYAENDRCIEEAANFVQTIISADSKIEVLMVFNCEHFLDFMYFECKYRKWKAEVPLEGHQEALCVFLNALFKWKSSGSGRECKLVSTGNVLEFTVAMIAKMRCADSDSGYAPAQSSQVSINFSAENRNQLHLDNSSEKGSDMNNLNLSAMESSDVLHLIIFPTHANLSSIRTKQQEMVNVSAKTNSSSREVRDEYLEFPESVVPLSGSIACKILTSKEIKAANIVFNPAHIDWYQDGKHLLAKESAFYRLEMVLVENYMKDEESVRSFNSTASVSIHYQLRIQEVVEVVDLLKLNFGPIVGKVTTDEARVMFEFNLPLDCVECLLRPIGVVDETAEVRLRHTSVPANKPIIFHFQGLRYDSKYEILLPGLYKGKVLGKFKTLPSFRMNIELIMAGQHLFQNVPIVGDIIPQFTAQQTLAVDQLSLLNSLEQTTLSDPFCGSMWTKLCHHMQTKGVLALGVFHMSPLTIFSLFWPQLRPHLLEYAERIKTIGEEEEEPSSEIKVGVKKCLSEFYLEQLEMLIHDSLRVLWSSPAIAQVFSSSSHFPLFHSSYILPALYSTPNEEDVDDNEFAITRKIRKIYESQVLSYVSNLYGVDDERKDNLRSWRLGSLLVILVDIISGRGKLKKNSSNADEEGEGEKSQSKDAKNNFTLGFLDRTQWKAIRSFALDKSISQMILVFEKPLIPLTQVPNEFVSPVMLPKGEMIPWQPTTHDLQIFCKFWVDWINSVRTQSNAMESRSVLFVSQSEIPFSTLIQDLKSGIKLYQLCVGRFSGDQPIDQSLSFKADEYATRGKIGSFRYAHSLQYQDYYTTTSFGSDSNQQKKVVSKPSVSSKASELESPGNLDNSEAKGDVMTDSTGYAQVKILLDAWNPTTIWTNCALHDNANKDNQEAILLVGPIVGVPSFLPPEGEEQHQHEGMWELSNMTKRKVQVPILVELDRASVVELWITPLFGKKSLKMKVSLPALEPTVIQLTPLDLQERYTITFVSGIKASSHTDFVLNTHYDEHENNIIVMNCDMPELLQQAPASVLLIDIFRRCQFPFHGVNTVVHVNFQPNFDKLIEEYQHHLTLRRLLLTYKKSGLVSRELRKEISDLFMVFREQFRDIFARPSYREVLKSGTNLLIPQLTKFTSHDLFGPITDASIDDIEEELGRRYSIALLLLVEQRVVQEYVDQLRFSPDKVFRAVSGKSAAPQVAQSRDEAIQSKGLWTALVEEDLRQRVSSVTFFENKSSPVGTKQESNVNTAPVIPAWEIVWFNKEADSVETVLQQWLNEMWPAPSLWIPYATLNQQLVIEAVPSITANSISYIQSSLQLIEVLHLKTTLDPKTPSALHNRLILIHDKATAHDSVANLASLTSQSMEGHYWTFFQALQTWKKSDEYSFQLLSASVNYGSKVLEVSISTPPLSFRVHLIDSTYRSNEYDRRIKMAEKENVLMPKKKSSAAAMKSKRAQKKKQEEEQKIMDQIRAEIAEFMSNQAPDGYLFVQTHTMNMVTTVHKPVTDAVSLLSNEQEVTVVPTPQDVSPPADSINPTIANEQTGSNPSDATAGGEPSNPQGIVPAPPTDVMSAAPLMVDDKPKPAKEPTSNIQHIVHIINQLSCSFLGDRMKETLAFQGKESNEVLMETTHKKFDTLQLPPWLLLFLPTNTIIFDSSNILTSIASQVPFLCDEVWFVMRQDSSINVFVQQLQDDHVYQSTIMQLYEKSRLSELSRPEDLREVDFSVDGVTKLFLKELLVQLWNTVLPEELKSYMFLLYDEFILSYCFSKVYANYVTAHYSTILNNFDKNAAWDMNGGETDPLSALPSWEVLCSSPKVFAEAMEELCVYSLAMKTAYKMFSNKKYDYIKQRKPFELKVIEYLEQEEDELLHKRFLELQEAGFDDSQRRVLAMLNTKGKDRRKSMVENPAAKKNIDLVHLTPEEENKLIASFAGEDSDLEDIDRIPSKSDGKPKASRETEQLVNEARGEKKANLPKNNRAEDDDDDEKQESNNGVGEEELAQQLAARTQLQLDVLTGLIDIVSEALLKDATELAANQLVQENLTFASKELNEAQYYDRAQRHIMRVKLFRERIRRIHGNRINFFG